MEGEGRDGNELRELTLACPRPSGTWTVVASQLNAAESKWRNLSCVLIYKFCVLKNNPDKNESIKSKKKREKKLSITPTHTQKVKSEDKDRMVVVDMLKIVLYYYLFLLISWLINYFPTQSVSPPSNTFALILF